MIRIIINNAKIIIHLNTASLLLEPAASINFFVIIAVPTLSNEVNEPSIIKRIINGNK